MKDIFVGVLLVIAGIQVNTWLGFHELLFPISTFLMLGLYIYLGRLESK